MYNSKLLDLLRTFSSRDLRRFDAFLRSPYFNRDEDLIALFSHLRSLSPKFPERKLGQETVWQAVFPGQAYLEKTMAYHMNHLQKLGEQFLAWEGMQDRPIELARETLSACENRGLNKHAHLALKRLNKQIEAYPYRTEEYHRLQYERTGVEIVGQSRRQVRTYDRHLADHVRHLDQYYLAARLRLTCELVNRQSILSQSYDVRQVEALLNYLAAMQEGEAVPAVAIYHCILLLLTQGEDEQHFVRLKELLADHLDQIPDEERNEIYSYAQNYCIRKVRQGHPRYLQELFALYQSGLQNGFFLENGQLSPWKYKNIASVGLRVKEYDWVEAFIGEYREMLPPEFRETAYAYNLAFLRYQRGELKQALRHLLEVEFNDVFYSLDTRKMMLMIYFEQRSEEPMLSLIAAFRTYLRRNKLISEQNRQAYRNFVDLVFQLYRSDGSKQEMKQRIRETQPLVEESWLLEMAERGF
jgi:hypothetical protein